MAVVGVFQRCNLHRLHPLRLSDTDVMGEDVMTSQPLQVLYEVGQVVDNPCTHVYVDVRGLGEVSPYLLCTGVKPRAVPVYSGGQGQGGVTCKV